MSVLLTGGALIIGGALILYGSALNGQPVGVAAGTLICWFGAYVLWRGRK